MLPLLLLLCVAIILLLFIVLWRMAKFVAGSLNLIPGFYFCPFKRYVF